jgi:hypothetical protein
MLISCTYMRECYQRSDKTVLYETVILTNENADAYLLKFY